MILMNWLSLYTSNNSRNFGGGVNTHLLEMSLRLVCGSFIERHTEGHWTLERQEWKEMTFYSITLFN